jgi:cytochrome c oxidase assembly factor CtaG/putative copper export protein
MAKILNSTKRASLAFALSVGAGLIALLIGLVIGGGAAASALADAGAVVRYGQPIAKLIMNFSTAVAVGSLIFAAFALQDKSRLLGKALDLASVSAIIWAISGATNFLFTYLYVSGSGISVADSFGQSLWMFATTIELGTSLGLNVLAAIAISVLAIAARSLTATALLAALGVAGLVPLALIGHAAGTASHSMAVNAIGMHLVAVVAWVGGLVALFMVRGESYEESALLTRRYSSLALAAYLLVAVSGVSAALIRITKLEDIFSAYGALVLLKVAALGLLGLMGAVYRLRLTRRLQQGAQIAKSFFSLIAVEFAIMGIAMGLATALAKTAPPGGREWISDVTPAQLLTGEPLPPELTPIRFLTMWKLDLVWAIICVAAVVAYVMGVRRLAKRGDKWPVMRTVSWISGMAVLFYVTSGALNAYQEYLFSIHMIGHMILAMGIPVLLVPGAPVTLLMRAVENRTDASRGVREWVLWAVHTKYARFISNPLIAAVLFASSLVTFYYTPLFAWATHEHIGHEWMIVHFLITGYLFAQALIGIDPGPARLPFAARLLLLIGTMAFHAFFGLSLMDGSGLLLADWYGAMGRTWGEDPLSDQHTGGAIAWGIGEMPTAALTLIVCIQWFKSDTRDAKRLDRQSDRTGNKDVEEYNEMLARLAARDAAMTARNSDEVAKRAGKAGH